MLEAVLFDWSNTLVEFAWDDELLVAGHRAALGRDDPDFTARYRELVLGDPTQRPYAELLAELGVDDPDAFIDEEHAVWLDALPEALRDGATGEALQAIVDLDLDELVSIEPPRGFRRD